MIIQIIGWFAIVISIINFVCLTWKGNELSRESKRDIWRSMGIFLIVAAICFK